MRRKFIKTTTEGATVTPINKKRSLSSESPSIDATPILKRIDELDAFKQVLGNQDDKEGGWYFDLTGEPINGTAWEKRIERARETGLIRADHADEFCVGLLRLHPDSLYGEGWYEIATHWVDWSALEEELDAGTFVSQLDFWRHVRAGYMDGRKAEPWHKKAVTEGLMPEYRDQLAGLPARAKAAA